jgi:predicted porin
MNLQGLNMKRFLAVACLSSLAVLTHASDSASGIYLGAEYGRTQVDNVVENTDKDASGIFLGYNFGNGFSVELGYRNLLDLKVDETFYDVDLGATLGVSAKTEVTAIHLLAEYVFPINDALGVSIRAGAAQIESDTTGSGWIQDPIYLPESAIVDLSHKSSSTVVVAGIGAQYRINAITLRATYDHYDRTDELELDVFAVGAAWNF